MSNLKPLNRVSFRLRLNVVVRSAGLLLRSQPLTKQEQVYGVCSVRATMRLLCWIQFLTIVVVTHSAFLQGCVTELTVE